MRHAMKHALKIGFSLLLLAAAALPARAETDIQEIVTPSGVTIWLVEEHSIPMVAIELNFRGGTSLDLPGKEGAAYLMAGLLEEGAGDMDAGAFLRATEGLAAGFSYSAYRDSVSISAEMLSENATEATALLRLALTQPRFDEVAIERVRSQVLSGLASDATDPNEIAGTTLRNLSYPDHPYGNPSEGTTQSVTALTRDDLIAAHARTLVRDRMFVGVVGDVTADEAAALVDQLVSDLPLSGPALPGPTQMAIQGGTTVVDLDVPQSVALFAHDGMDRDDPDYLAAYVLNEIFGGSGLEARLKTEVREKRGLTYGVYSYLAPSDHASQVIGSVASSNERVAEALTVIKDEWRKIGEQGITAQELEAAKLYLTGAYALRFDSNVKIAGNLVGMQAIGLPIDYIRTRNDQVNAITLDEINRVAADLYRVDALHVVVVGKPEGLDAE